MKTALVLSGGGARAAYQVGVLKAVIELLPDKGKKNPFDILCGTSSGAINAAKLACSAENFVCGVNDLEFIWSEIDSEQVHCVGYRYLLKSVLKLIGSFFRQGVAFGRPLALFDNSPLRETLAKHLELGDLPFIIEGGHLHALCITALGYSTGQNLNFYQGADSITPWRSAKRRGFATDISCDHIMASLALPTMFPPVLINREYFGDGALRQTAPLSAALHLGAEKIMVIGVAGQSVGRHKVTTPPSVAQVMGQLVASAFIDSLSEDIEMFQRFNDFANCLTPEQMEKLNVRPVELLVIEPTIKFGEVAARFISHLPNSMRLLLRITGANSSSTGESNLGSYILFEKDFCRELIRQGYADAMQQADAIRDFMQVKCTHDEE